jgi:hypothetical protein
MILGLCAVIWLQTRVPARSKEPRPPGAVHAVPNR